MMLRMVLPRAIRPVCRFVDAARRTRRLTSLRFTVEVQFMSAPLRCFIVLVFFAAITQAADWPQWRGPLRTGYVPASEAVPKELPVVPKVLWHMPLTDGVSSPVVAGGKVICLDGRQNKEVVHAFDAASGQVLWSVPLDDLHKDSQTKPGPRCTPLIDGDRVYAQSCRGELKCLALADGKELWQVNYVKNFGATYIGEKGNAQGATRHGYDGSPLIDGDHLIAEAGGRDAAFVCFDKLTGKVVWKSQNNIPAYAPPIIATVAGVRQLIAFMVEGAVAIDPADGKLLWKVPVKTALGRHVTTPVVADDMVMVASHQAGLIGIKISKEGDGLKADRVWVAKDSAINFSSPVTVGEFLYGLGPNKNLICVDCKTGKQQWSKSGFSGSDGGHAHAGILVMGDNLLVLADNGQLVLVAADPKAYREISRVQVCGTTWCNPAYADGKLYLRDARELKCIELLPQ
jgi:outer membrane protein assembly factor BamB